MTLKRKFKVVLPW